MKESHQSTPAEALFPLANHTVHLQVKVSTCVRDIWLHSHNSWVPLGEREVLGGGTLVHEHTHTRIQKASGDHQNRQRTVTGCGANPSHNHTEPTKDWEREREAETEGPKNQHGREK